MTILDAAAERRKLRRVLGRLDPIFVTHLVGLDTAAARCGIGGDARC
jgi:hypothetical protein